MLAYHDEVWGVPQRDPIALFELLVLEGAQAGLSWRTILEKQEGYRRAFAGFDPVVVAAFEEDDLARLVTDPGIVRNRAKIAAAVGNAQAWRELDDPVGFLWDFVGGKPVQTSYPDLAALPASTAASEMMSKELKRRGFRFVGPTICYAFMQASGMVNDHVLGCFRRSEVAALG
jgi:DNA-3-methyladenine glycosylase I